MIFKLNNLKNLIYKNMEIIFLFLLIIITVSSTKFYNSRKLIVNENYKNYRFYWVFFDFLTLLN